MQLSIAHNASLNNNQSPTNYQPNFPKIKCAFHPHQVITNFCTCQCCLLPLCPACIKIHTNEHINLKGINPQYQPINQLLEQIYLELQELIDKNSDAFHRVTEIEARVGTFRTAIQQKICNLKANVLSQVQKYFDQLQENVKTDIQNMSYVKILNQYKDQLKKSVIGLKNIEKCFTIDNHKIMRTVIKYKGGDIKNQVQQFEKKASQFLRQVNHNFVTFSIREDYIQIIQSYLDSIRKIQISDINTVKSVPSIFNKIRDVYEKDGQQSKKEIIKSLGSLLQNSTLNGNNKDKKHNNRAKKTKNDHQNSLNSSIQTDSQHYMSCVGQQSQTKHRLQSYNSVSNEIRNMHANRKSNKTFVDIDTPIKDIRETDGERKAQPKRRSLSKGKGLSLMQLNTMPVNTFGGQNMYQIKGKGNYRLVNNGPRVIDIPQPHQFHRTTIIRRKEYQ